MAPVTAQEQVTPQFLKDVFMILAASASEHLVFFVSIVSPAFLQAKEMLLPSFFQVRDRG